MKCHARKSRYESVEREVSKEYGEHNFVFLTRLFSLTLAKEYGFRHKRIERFGKKLVETYISTMQHYLPDEMKVTEKHKGSRRAKEGELLDEGVASGIYSLSRYWNSKGVCPDMEKDFGIKASWFFVPKYYQTETQTIFFLRARWYAGWMADVYRLFMYCCFNVLESEFRFYPKRITGFYNSVLPDIISYVQNFTGVCTRDISAALDIEYELNRKLAQYGMFISGWNNDEFDFVLTKIEIPSQKDFRSESDKVISEIVNNQKLISSARDEIAKAFDSL